MTATTETAPAKRDNNAVIAEATDHLRGLIGKADKGDKTALATLRTVLDGAPNTVKLLTGLADTAEGLLLDALGAEHLPGTRAVMQRQLATMRRDLSGPDATPLERLLVERLVADWLFAQFHDAQYGARLNKEALTIKQSEYWQRGRERAQREFLRSAQTLATVRRLLGPAVQVNLIDKQLNVNPPMQADNPHGRG